MQEEEELTLHKQTSRETIEIEPQFTEPKQHNQLNKIPSNDILEEDSDGDGHDHSGHDHSGHDHSSCKKKSGSKNPHQKHQKNFGIIFYCVFTSLSCFYLEVYCLLTLQEDEAKRNIQSFLSGLIVFMAMWSYFQTIRTKNNFPKLKGSPNITYDEILGNNYLAKECKNCNFYKPPRVSHCSTCGTCILKLDHHCMWTQNCIGYRNQKPFYLFTLYMAIGLYQFWSATIFAIGKMYGSCKFFSFFEPGVYILWAITCFSALVVGMMIVALFISHTFMILTNHTTLMSMKQKRMCPLPFIEFRDMILDNEFINPYDRGEIQNIRNLFGTNIFLAFLPTTREIDHDFLFEPENPDPTKGQLSELSGGESAEISRDEELKKTILRLKEIFKGQSFTMKGESYEVK